MTKFTTLCLAFLASFTIAVAGDWQEITNGKDLSNFAPSEGNWKVTDDGIIELIPRKGERGWKRFGSYIFLKNDYTDFVCEFEFKFEKKGNSGFYFRVANRKDPVGTGTELQLNDTPGKENPGFHDAGGIIKLANANDGAPLKSAIKAAGEWNKVIVTLKGSKMTVVMNGETVQNEKDVSSAVGGLAPTGGICFQDHGLPFWLRNVRIKAL